MGILDFVTSGIKAVCPEIGLFFEPAKMLVSALDLTGVISEIVPKLGAVATHAIPVLDSIFGQTERQKIGQFEAEFANLQRGQGQIMALINAVQTSLQEGIGRIEAISDEVMNKIDRNALLPHYHKVSGAIAWLKSQEQNLATLTPLSGPQMFSQFVGNQAGMLQKRDDLVYGMSQLEIELDLKLKDGVKSCGHTEEMINLYMTMVTWMLIYFKSSLHLRGYLARAYLLNADIENYIQCLADWNSDLYASQANITQAIEFILGKGVGSRDLRSETGPGILMRIRDARLGSFSTKPTGHEKDGHKQLVIEDAWPTTGFGYAGPGTTKNDGKPIMMEQLDGIPDDVFYATSFNYYKMVNMTYFNHAAEAVIEVVKKWQTTLVEWTDRLPVTPPPKVNNNAIEHIKVTLTEKESKKKYPGYSADVSVRYALSYVTRNGEGQLTGWTPPQKLVKGEEYKGFKLEFNTLINPLHPTNWIAEKEIESNDDVGNSGKSLQDVRRVYVIYTLKGDKPRYAWLGDFKEGHDTFGDYGVESHGFGKMEEEKEEF